MTEQMNPYLIEQERRRTQAAGTMVQLALQNPAGFRAFDIRSVAVGLDSGAHRERDRPIIDPNNEADLWQDYIESAPIDAATYGLVLADLLDAGTLVRDEEQRIIAPPDACAEFLIDALTR